MSTTHPALATLGAVPDADGTSWFRVWAPAARSVAVEIDDVRTPLEHHHDGVFEGRLAASAGSDYWFVLDGAERLPDPCSRCQPEGLRGPSRIVDVHGLSRQGADLGAVARDPHNPLASTLHPARDWEGLALEELVIYELHVGSFSRAGHVRRRHPAAGRAA